LRLLLLLLLMLLVGAHTVIVLCQIIVVSVHEISSIGSLVGLDSCSALAIGIVILFDCASLGGCDSSRITCCPILFVICLDECYDCK
jgi:hypothetical protein